jgi:hypothetical protein
LEATVATSTTKATQAIVVSTSFVRLEIFGLEDDMLRGLALNCHTAHHQDQTRAGCGSPQRAMQVHP